jgi:predicted heme/steroid binding protein/DMSO/TMAO reductase YedYZ heme-binding membrane subunit
VAKTFTLKELARFDGKDGRAAYVAVDGTVYDLSASSLWPEGEHVFCELGARGGHDLSSEIKYAPSNMRSKLAEMPVAGHVAPATNRSRPATQIGLIALSVVLLAVPFIAMGLNGFGVAPASLAALRTLALVAFTLLFVDLSIGAFRPLLTHVYKARPLQRTHAGIGMSAFALALVHGSLILNLGVRGYPRVWLLGPTVLVLLLAVITTALNRRRLRNAWRWVHRLNYVLFGLIIGHAYILGFSLITQPFMRVIFLVYAALAAAGLGYRVQLLARRPKAPPRPVAKD